MLTDDQVKTIADRSAAGEGVNAIIESLGFPLHDTLIDLRDNHRQVMLEAKQKQKNQMDDGVLHGI